MPIHRDLERVLGRQLRDVALIPDGHSGFTYWVQFADGERGVLRLPPPGARIAGPADIPRQGRLMQALGEAGLPVPPIIAMSKERVVDGRPFVLMAVADGKRIEDMSGQASDEELARSAVEILRQIHSVGTADTGIGHEPPVTLSAELSRWGWLMQHAPRELREHAPALADLLAERLPKPRVPTLVHGDYHYGNMLFQDGRVVAVLDWEIAEIGQPLLDLACLSVVANGGRSGPGVPGAGHVDVSDELLMDAYGADPTEYKWYVALTYFKYAAIFAYNLVLHRRGKRVDPTYESRTGTIVSFIDEGIRLLSTGGTGRRVGIQDKK
jgi:aminoglycoside phosphotransferase (APT) family kinase protein